MNGVRLTPGGAPPKAHVDELGHSGPILPTRHPYTFHPGLRGLAGAGRPVANAQRIPDPALFDVLAYQPGIARTQVTLLSRVRETLAGRGRVPIASNKDV
jgi:hypothetical protein